MDRPLRPLLVAIAASAALLATACTGSSSTPSATVTRSETQTRISPTATAAASTATARATATTTSTGATGATGATGTAAVRVKVSANTGTSAEIQAALQANGVPNPANWTREVIEYRPYPADDANLTKLRQNLAKYNPGPGVVDAIVTALKP